MIEKLRRIGLTACALVAVASCGGSDEDTDGGIVNVQKPKWTVSVAGSGSGRITSSAGGIDCRISNGSVSGTCSATLDDKAAVILTAAPDPDQLFKAWTGGDCATNPCSLTLTRNVSASAGFVGKVVNLALSYVTPTTDDGAVLLAITGPSISGITAGAGIQIVQRTRTSDGKPVVLVQGNLTSGVLGTVAVGGLDADKAFTVVVEQVAARKSTDPARNYVQPTSLAPYSATIK
jgi:hypothetical protein